MHKKIITIFMVFILLMGINLTTYTGYKKVLASPKSKSTKIERISPNFPVSINLSLSLAINRSQVIKRYGEPNTTKVSDDLSYDIWKLKDDTNMIAIYNQNRFIHIVKFKSPLTKKDFKDIQLGKTSYKNIKKIDPYMYLFKNGKKAISEHILTDNIVLQIDYMKDGKKWLVSEYKFMDKILPFPDIYNINK